MRYVEMQRLLDEHWLQRRFHYWKSGFVRSVSTDFIESVVEQAAAQPSPATNIVLQQMHGAASRVGPAETAFAHRHQQYDFAIYSMWSEPSDTEKNVKWTREFWEALQPFVERSVYVNNLGEEGDERVRAAYGPKLSTAGGGKEQVRSDELLPPQPQCAADRVVGIAAVGAETASNLGMQPPAFGRG